MNTVMGTSLKAEEIIIYDSKKDLNRVATQEDVDASNRAVQIFSRYRETIRLLDALVSDAILGRLDFQEYCGILRGLETGHTTSSVVQLVPRNTTEY